MLFNSYFVVYNNLNSCKRFNMRIDFRVCSPLFGNAIRPFFPPEEGEVVLFTS
jgi:hypothetical protein